MMDVRMSRRIAAALRAGARGALERPMVFLLAVATMAAGLLVLGAYLLVVANRRGVLARAGDELALVAFTELRGDASDSEVATLEKHVRAEPTVSQVRWVSPAEALERLRADLGDDAGVLEGLE